MRARSRQKLDQGWFPALGVSTEVGKTAPVPKTSRPTTCSCAVSRCRDDPLPTERPSPCWSARWLSTHPMRPLGQPWVCATTSMGNTSNGGEAMLQRSEAACERAVALDPNLMSAATQLITDTWITASWGRLSRRRRPSQPTVRKMARPIRFGHTSSVTAGLLDESAASARTLWRWIRELSATVVLPRCTRNWQDRPVPGLCSA